MASIDIAKESTVSEAKTNIGTSADTESSSGTTLFAKLKYAVTSLSTLGSRLTNTRMGKIDGIGDAADSVLTASVFGKLNKVTALSGEEKGTTITTAASGEDVTITLLSEEDTPVTAGNSGTTIGYFKADYTGLVKITAKMYITMSGLFQPTGYIRIWEQTTKQTFYRYIVSTQSQTETTVTNTIRVNAGKVYAVQLYCSNTWLSTTTATMVKFQYAKKEVPVFTDTLLPSDAVVSTLTPSPASGTDTSYAEVASATITGEGAVRVKLTIPSSYASKTKVRIKRGGNTVGEYDPSGNTAMAYDIDVRKGDSLTIETAAVSGDNPSWRLTSATINYDKVLKGENPYFINTWEEVTL